MQTSQKIIGGIAVIALVFGLISFFRGPSSKTTTIVQPGQSQPTQTFGNTSIDGSQSILPNPSNFDYLVARLALGLGTNLSNSNTGSGNVVYEAQAASIAASSSVLCSLVNPFNSTSTIVNTSIYFTTAPTSTLQLVEGTSTVQQPTATSSGMQTVSVPVSATGTAFTWDAGVNNNVVGTGQVVTFGIGGGSANAGNYAPAGKCQGVFISVQ